MFKRVTSTLFKAAIPAVVASLTLATAASASSAGPNVSFGASNDGASAGWSSGKGSPIDLTLGSSSGTYALVEFHHLPATRVSDLSEPTFVTDNYSAGSPRYYITLHNGDTLWGYPSNSGLNGSDFAWAINNGNTYLPWSTVQADEGSAHVTGAWVIADGDQPAGTTDAISCLSFGSYNANSC